MIQDMMFQDEEKFILIFNENLNLYLSGETADFHQSINVTTVTEQTLTFP